MLYKCRRIWLSVVIVCLLAASASGYYSVARKLEIRNKVTEQFYHGYSSYMKFAFPKDELKPLSCKGDDTFGGYSLTLIDTLDMLALVGDYPEFMKQVHYVSRHVQYGDRVVSVFETTIRVLGGLITAHHLAIKICAEMADSPLTDLYTYDGGLLRKATELADLLLPAFDTPTGIPYNELNMRTGTQKSKGHATCPAGAGSLLLEFGALTALTGNCKYLAVAERALEGVWKHRSGHSLVGSMIDVFSGKWINGESSIGASIDSFFEYMVKSYMYFDEDKFLDMWTEAYKAVQKYTYFGGWYLSSSVDLSAPIDNIDHKFNSLQAFWPGLQVLAGDVHNALDSWGKMWCVVEKIGLPPEYVDLASFFSGNPQTKRTGPGYPLRPEFLESTFFLYRATGEERFLEISEKFVSQIQRMKQRCGFSAVVDVYTFAFEDKMDSFVLAETFKYLYLMFTPTDADVRLENALRREAKAVRIARDFGPNADASMFPDQDGERPLDKFKLLYNLDDDLHIVNTEAHPLLIDSTSQQIFKKCKKEREGFLLPLNEPSRIRDDNFRAYHRMDKNLAPNDWDKKRMCKPVDYMLDIAPFIQNTFYNADYCLAPPSTKVLGHSLQVLKPQMSYDVIVRRSSEKGRPGIIDPRTDVQLSVELPPDPLVEGSRVLKLQIHTKVSVPASIHSTYTPPSVASHFGVYSVPLVQDPDSLLLANQLVFIRRAPTDGANATTYKPTDLYIQTTNANYGPQLCMKGAAANPSVLQVPMSGSVYRPTGKSTGCTALDIGDTSTYERPFGIAIDRGECTFREKTQAAQVVGASFVVIVNTVDDHLIQMGDSPDHVKLPISIPAIMINRKDEDFILPSRASTGRLNVDFVCARNGLEQYKLFGVTLVPRASDILLFRHRHQPLVDAFVVKTSPEALRPQYTDPRVDCRSCALVVNIGSTLVDLNTSNFANKGVYGGSFRGHNSRRLQFALTSRELTIGQLPLLTLPRTRSSKGVAYYFGTADDLHVAEIRHFELSDAAAFNYYNNRLGAWLEKFGLECGVGATFFSVNEDGIAVEVTLYTNTSSLKSLKSLNISEAFSQGQVLRTIREQFVKNVNSEIFSLGREHFIQP